jgi:hypothetical protein
MVEPQAGPGISGRAAVGSALFLVLVNWPLVSVAFEAEPLVAYLLLFSFWLFAILLTVALVRLHLARPTPPSDKNKDGP